MRAVAPCVGASSQRLLRKDGARQVAGLLSEARCDDVAVLDVRPRECSFTDFFVLATGRSHQHVFTAAHAVRYAVRPRRRLVTRVACCPWLNVPDRSGRSGAVI